MILEASDLQWLRDAFPGLSYDPDAQVVAGDLDFCARYDVTTKRLRIEGVEGTPASRGEAGRLCDVFTVRIELDTVAEAAIDWPEVYESGGRCASIARALAIPIQDLHVNSDGSCCLGIQDDPGPRSFELFVCHLVIPFFYRVAYAERLGIARTRQDLWDEYRHGSDGLRDRVEELSSARRGRNNPCSCGSGRKYKVCCERSNEDRLRSLRGRLETMSSRDGPQLPGGSRAARRRRSIKR